ncbi:MAG: phospholipase D-like domain-containing protein [Propionicimonas sp.]|uniref:phospholipase D-like domain-containing protein n=1 Tax=Propionicimonas sp. TaxID=1955623 RepID=UPI003D10D741
MSRRATPGPGTSLLALALAVAVALTACTGTPTSAPATSATTPVPSTPTTSATPPRTDEPTPGTTQRVVFGNPWSKDPARQHAVADSALEIINGTPTGETVTLSMFNMTYPGTAASLVRAVRRGVTVHVVLNSENADSTQATKLVRALGSDRTARSWVVVRTPEIRMHSKFLLSSRSNGEDKVVWVSSGNLTSADGRDQANEALVTTGDGRLYRFLRQQFALFRAGVTDPTRLGRTATTATATVRTFPLPEGGEANDPVLALLDDVSCVHDGDATTIRVAHLFLTSQRLYLVDRFRALEAAGCDVRLLAHLPQWTPLAREQLTAPGAGRIDLRSTRGTALHTKILTIEGRDAAGQPLEVAMVGTHNLSGRALTVTPDGVNDEVSLTVHNPDIVSAYSAWIDMVIARHSNPA